MNQQALVYWKFGIVTVAVVGTFVLAAIGKLSADSAVRDVGIIVGSLVGALGISGAGSAVAMAMRPRGKD